MLPRLEKPKGVIMSCPDMQIRLLSVLMQSMRMKPIHKEDTIHQKVKL